MFKELRIKTEKVMNAYSCLFSVAKLLLSTTKQGPKMILRVSVRVAFSAGPGNQTDRQTGDRPVDRQVDTDD